MAWREVLRLSQDGEALDALALFTLRKNLEIPEWLFSDGRSPTSYA